MTHPHPTPARRTLNCPLCRTRSPPQKSQRSKLYYSTGCPHQDTLGRARLPVTRAGLPITSLHVRGFARYPRGIARYPVTHARDCPLPAWGCPLPARDCPLPARGIARYEVHYITVQGGGTLMHNYAPSKLLE